MDIEAALKELNRSYTYNPKTEDYENISCCWKRIQFQTYFWLMTDWKCEVCWKQLTRKDSLWWRCFINVNVKKIPDAIAIWDKVYYISHTGAEPEEWIVSSYCDDSNFIFVRFKWPNGERTPISKLIF
jgi:hypothetical protein